MKEGAPGWKGRCPFLWRVIAAARMLRQIRAAQGSYALSPPFITHHIKMKPGWAFSLLTLDSHLVMVQSALAETGGGWNRAYATTGETWLALT
jgi:hypothetical protein